MLTRRAGRRRGAAGCEAGTALWGCSINHLGYHLNVATPEAARSILAAPSHLKILNTALDLNLIREWRQRCPEGLLVYRHVFEGGDSQDVGWRTDVVSREAEALLAFGGVVAETPWNEERQDDPLIAAYAADTIRSARLLSQRGFRVSVGHFSVTWPKLTGLHAFEPALDEADYLDLHEYGAPSVLTNWGAWAGRCTRVWAVLPWDIKTRLKIIIGEVGIDYGVVGETLSGWRSHGGTPAAEYARQLREAADRYPPWVAAAFIYCAGGIYGWQSFDVQGVPEIERAIREEVPEAVTDYAGGAWLPSPNFGYPNGSHGRQGHLPVAIVDHIAEGTKAGALAWLCAPASDRSAHYVVGADGTVTQLVAEADAAWGCGWDTDAPITAYNPDLAVPWIRDAWEHQVNPNLVSINIEHEGFTGRVLPELQVRATIALHRDIFRRHGWPVADHARAIGHCRLDSVNRPRDPGPTFPWARLWAELAPTPGLDFAALKVYGEWATARCRAREDPRLLAAFTAHVRALGLDASTPRRWGWPC